MLIEKIKKLVYVLLLAINLYLLILILPSVKKVFLFAFGIILPFMIAFIISFILQPFVQYLQKYLKKRWISVLVVILLTIALLFLFIRYIVTMLIMEIKELSIIFPDLIKDFENLINFIINKFDFIDNKQIKIYDNIMGYFNNNSNELIDQIVNNKTLTKLVNILKYIIILPMIVVYMLIDYEKIINFFRNYLIRNNKIHFKNYLGELNKVLSSYFRGVFFVMIILFMVFSIIFLILDIENGLVFALIIAITNVIPYVGSWIGTGIPVVYVLLTNTNKALIVFIICTIIQTIEANVLSPLVHGKRIKIHPLLLILSLLFFGALFGFFGMLIAVPMAAFINITLKYYPIKIIKTKKDNL